jgi:hypothetical protein
LGAPSFGENREAGVNPARSRHCDENVFSKPGDLPETLCSLLNTRAKVFRPCCHELL